VGLSVVGLVWVLGRLRRVTVEGSSMEPALYPGDRLLIVPVFRPRLGQIVAVTDPRDLRRLLVKRVLSVDRGTRVISVEGDNRDASTDSRTFGPLAWADVAGRAVYRYAPPSRVGTVGRRL
jgi:nickel-type superoxide dismutase maturation protease